MDNAIKNHWNSSMKRKIEKYLSNNDHDKIRYQNDGRFDFHGNLDGVLTAVRDAAENGGRSSGGPVKDPSRMQTSSSNCNGNVGAVGGNGGAQTPSMNTKTTTFSHDFSNSRSAYTNSASRNLFEDTSNHHTGNDSDVDVANNIFISPPSGKQHNDNHGVENENENEIYGTADSDQKRQLRSTFTTGRASIMETPKDKKRPARSPTFMSIKTPDANNFDLRGFTPLSNNAKHHYQGNHSNFAEILDSGLFSPGWPLGKDFTMEAESENDNNISSLSASFAEGVKTPHAKTPHAMTPHASDHPRMCIANVRFGDSPEKKKVLDRMQGEVAISPIIKVSLTALTQKRKLRSLFGDDVKKHKSDVESGGHEGMVTPSFSVSSNTTVTTHPLTVCSSASSYRTTMSLEELSKVRPIQIISSSLQTATNNNENDNNGNRNKNNQTNSPPHCFGMEPKHITQDTPGHHRESPPFSPPPNLDKVECILQSAKKLDVGTPAEKFWSSVGGLDNFTPFKMRGDYEDSTPSGFMSPTSNSECINMHYLYVI